MQIIASTRFDGVSSWLDSTFLRGWLFEGTMSDISPYWYRDVGQNLVINLLVQIVLRLLMVLVNRGLAR